MNNYTDLGLPSIHQRVGDFQYIGVRNDGWIVICTVDIQCDANTFEIKSCPTCNAEHIRNHDAEAYRKERSQ